MRRLKLEKSEVEEFNFTRYSVWRLRVEVTDSEDMDRRIFLFRRRPIDPYTGDVLDTFFTVCSAADLADYPPEEPDPLLAFPFFRRDSVEMDFRSPDLAEESWQIIQDEVEILIEGLNKMDTLVPVASVWIPSPPTPAESVSESASLSESISI